MLTFGELIIRGVYLMMQYECEMRKWFYDKCPLSTLRNRVCVIIIIFFLNLGLNWNWVRMRMTH